MNNKNILQKDAKMLFQKNKKCFDKHKEYKEHSEEWKNLLGYGNRGNENCNPLLAKNKFKSKATKFNIF
jgi:hypothetical protein